ncbi:iron uptake porin [Altericista sp. CCNU0014]|uniref:iron uptake porin n=1 Tax=Altericista sp. CCNU0014 TaxID=3082949 RepID=UPI00384F2C28
MTANRIWSRALLSLVLLAGAGFPVKVLAEEQLTVAALEGQNAPAVESNVHLSSLTGDVDSEAQVTSVSQLSDVQPTDWAFQALQSLVERYGCIAGYPDGTFRGNRAATRYELAAALNACLDRISDRFATKEDLAAVKALQEEFKAELATLKGRVDGLEARTKTLEAQQFSTTTKLQGEAIFAVSDVFGDRAGTGAAAGIGPEIDSRITFTQRVRLNFLTSFTGKDRLYVRLQTSNREVNFGGATGTNMSRLAFDTGNTNNNVVLDRLDYMFPVGKKLKINVYANGGFHHYYTTTVNPFFEGGGGGKGALSFFGERNPIYRIGTAGYSATSGVGATYQFTPKFRFDVGYLAGRANLSTATNAVNPNGFGTVSTDSGLFGGSYSALAQLSFKPTKATEVALTYVRNYAPDGNLRYFSGSNYANNPFVALGTNVAQPLISNSFGVQGSFRVLPQLAIGGWFGYTNADRANGVGNADIINGAVNIAIPDLFKKGAVGGLVVGVPPTVVGSSFIGAGGRRRDPSTPVHLEALYQFPINSNITITPGIIYLINPNADNGNSDIIVGVVRTTFTF